jgi:RHS repeat-associated protein
MDTTTACIYGPGTAPIEQVKLSDGTTTYLLADRLGSIRGTINTSGALTHTTSYDAWGNPQTSGGLTTNTPFGYAGNYTDPTGLTYNIRRYYDPATGQFISVDPAVDETEQPYSYAGDDPIDAIDSLGLGCSFLGTLNPFSSNNCINQWAASGSPSSALLTFNPAFSAINGYENEASAWEQGCSLWTVAKYGAEGALGVVATGTVAVGGTVVVGRVLGEGADAALWDGWRGTNMSDEDSFNYHYEKHGAGRTPEQYAEDARTWARNPTGTPKEVPLRNGEIGYRYRTPGGGPGGIVDQYGNIITFWYGP